MKKSVFRERYATNVEKVAENVTNEEVKGKKLPKMKKKSEK